jgi:two-component system CheB/CheR fusion protein
LNQIDVFSKNSGLFPIVGIGASAGGLLALEQFLDRVPLNGGMAYVVVQHLDPNRQGMLVELLQRHCALPVVEAKDQMEVEPNHVYVIPPGHDLSVLANVLHLFDPAEPHGFRLPIDFFFKSLADDRQHNSIGVILSGMGMDGTLGLRAIRQAAGACFVQRPDTAQFDSMPRSAIDAGVADVVAAPEELPEKIMAFVGHVVSPSVSSPTAEIAKEEAGFLDKVIVVLRTHTGHDFSAYKKSTIQRRVERRMGLHQLPRMSDYLRYLRANPPESKLLFSELLIGVTNFFRDPDMWEQLKAEVVTALLASYPQGCILRAWVPACSTGEEAYSLAMVFKEVLEELKPTHRFSLQIFASDLDPDAIATARAGVYPRSIGTDVSEKRLNRFFVEDPGGFRVCNEIREMIIFAQHNLIADPPFTKLHLLSCRNLMIYLESELQAKLVQLFHYSLNREGFLVLGNAEAVPGGGELFTVLPGKSRIYKRLDAPLRVLPLGFPSAFKSYAGSTETQDRRRVMSISNLQAAVEHLVLLRFAPAAVLVTDQGEVLYFSGKTGRYLEPAAGKPSTNLFSMAREGLSQALSETFHRAVRDQTPGSIKHVKIEDKGDKQYVDVLIQPLNEPEALRGMVLIVFFDVAAPKRKKPADSDNQALVEDARLIELANDLQQSREEAKSTREEMQSSQEELKSTNEELQSTNEELQSTNEELTTSKEEMQSMNEELQTVNHELQAKVTELYRASNDMRNLLDSTEIATLFLDDALRVRRFTAQTRRVYKLIPGDTGRLITDIVTDLQYPTMAQDAQQVLRSLVFSEKDVPTADERWFKVRIMPYRTHENRIDGLVMTFFDITQAKKLEAELIATQIKLKALMEK